MLEQIEVIEFLQIVDQLTHGYNYEGDLKEKLYLLDESYNETLKMDFLNHAYSDDLCIDISKDNYLETDENRLLRNVFAYFFDSSVDPDYQEPIDPFEEYKIIQQEYLENEEEQEKFRQELLLKYKL